jgi:hypothetical protein
MGMEARPGRIGPWLGGAILLGLVALVVGVAAVRGTVVAGQPVAAPVSAPPERQPAAGRRRRSVRPVPGRDETQEPVSCGRPHGFDQVSYRVGAADRFAEEELAACRLDAVDSLGSTDAIDSGAPQVVVIRSAFDERSGELITGPEARSADGTFYVDCMLAPAQADRKLTGPLRGLGHGSVPLR